MTTLSPLLDPTPSGLRSTPPARAAWPWVVTSLALLALLQVIALPTGNPFSGTISAMVYAPGGRALFAAMGATCAIGSLLLARSLRRLGATPAAAALGVWAAALVTAALVPTDPPGAVVVSLAAQVHRDAAVVMFIALPVAGLLAASTRAARRSAGRYIPDAQRRRLRRASIAAAAMGVAMVLGSLLSLAAGTAIATWPVSEALFEVRGAVERAAFLALFVVLLRIKSAVTEAAARPRTRVLPPLPPSALPDRLEAMTTAGAGHPVGNTVGNSADRSTGSPTYAATAHPASITREVGGPVGSPRGRLRQFVAAVVLTFTWPIGLTLFVVWSVTLALSPLTFVLPALVPLTAAVRWYATLHRRWAATALGIGVPIDGGSGGGTLATRLRRIVTNPTTWREVAWLPVHSSVGFSLAVTQVLLFLTIPFYACYPLLYAVTPQDVFGSVFGIVDIHSIGAAWLVTPVAFAAGALWWWAGPVLHRAHARLTHAMLGAAGSEPSV